MKPRKTENSARSRQRGSAIFETMAALLVLCLLFFALLQIFQWSIGVMFCEYSAFYASKGMALGYRENLALRAARVAAIAVSGRRLGRTNLSEQDAAGEYMTKGDASGVYYDYWYPQDKSRPELRLYGPSLDTLATSTVHLDKAPLIAPNLAIPLGIQENPEPRGTVSTYNYSKLYLE